MLAIQPLNSGRDPARGGIVVIRRTDHPIATTPQRPQEVVVVILKGLRLPLFLRLSPTAEE
jgi:hypothetical protein